jgi:hydrogenase maturation protease
MMDRARVLVAGIGNVFLGDDAFGVEVVAELQGRALPPGVRVVDLGIRAFDLAMALERCEAAILVDATARGGAPGTLYVLAPEPPALPEPARDAEAGLSPHGLTPDAILRRLGSAPPDARPAIVRIVGCEPETFGDDDGDAPAGLSGPVRAAVHEAVAVVERLVREILGSEPARA